MNLRVALFLFVIANSVVAFASPPVKNVTFRTFDADTGEPLIAKILIDGIQVPDNKYVLPDDADSRIGIEVAADAGKNYHQRSFTIYLEGLKRSEPYFHIFLAKSSPENSIYTRGMVRVASEYINEQFVDRAVALLERLNVEASMALMESQFGVYLRYNLGRAYWLNCSQRFVDQCLEAKRIFDDLSNHYDQRKNQFIAEAISPEMLRSAIDADSHYRRMTYLRAKWDLSCRRFEDALRAFEDLIGVAERDSSILTPLNLTIAGLKRDRDLAERKVKSD
jgi:hypothetical protein